MCDFPRLSDDAGTYPADTIGSWYTPHILQGAGRYDGTARIRVTAGTIADVNSAAEILLQYATRYSQGLLGADLYQYLVFGGGVVGTPGYDGWAWVHSGAMVTNWTLSVDTPNEVVLDLSWTALYPWQISPISWTNANQFALYAANPPYQWYHGTAWWAAVNASQYCEMVSTRVAQRMRSIYTLGGAQATPTYAHARGPKHLLPTVQDTTTSFRFIGPPQMNMVGDPFALIGIVHRFTDGTHPFSVNIVNAEAIRQTTGPHRGDDYFRFPLEYRAQYCYFSV